jgi:hypothetical protein
MMLNQLSDYIEFAYFLAIFLLSINIYIQTRKMQSFSVHRGIRYFKNAFLYFSIIYLFRFMVLNLKFLTGIITPEIEIALQSFGLFLVIYFSLLAIFSLISSFSWKKYTFITDNRLNLLSLFLSCIAFFIKLPSILLIVGFVIALFLLLKAYDRAIKNNRIFSPLFIIYTLLLFFILFDLVPITQELIPFEFRIIGYVGSMLVFLYINIKVMKVLGAGKDEAK